MSRGRLFAVLIALVLSLAMVPTAFAAGTDVKVGDVDATVYAPSVVWQATNAHVIVKLENLGSKPVTVDGLFKFPEGKDTQFTYGLKKGANAAPKEGATQSLKELKPGESKYIAFTYITPKSSAQLGQYTANLTLKVDGASKTIPWTFDVRTGAVFVAQTQSIVVMIYAISAAMLVFWFVYFKFFVNKRFNILAGEEV
ncbi:MAG: hypothetical protein M1380_02850 [Chloroflexi bacterium]|nr:hypothetical protein [Chloroflexota bacterium]